MMTLTLGLLTVSAYFLWRRKARWGWVVVMVALVIGIIIFVGDIDVSSSLGIQL